MKKEEWYKIGAIVLVLAFVFEGIAIGMLQNNGTNNGNTQQGAGEQITGNAVANFTVLRYEPYIIVSGNGSAIDAVKKKLIDSGVATYAVPNEGNLVVSLASSKSVVSSAEEFEAANATSVLATAVISAPTKVVVQGDGITTTVEGTSFRFQMRPIFEEGSQFPASFSAIAQDGQLVSMGNFNILPLYVQGAVVQAELVSGSAGQVFVELLWSNRTAAKQIVKESGATYKERSYIIIPGNATQQEIAALQQAGKDYITAVQQGVVSVRNDFADVNRSITDLQNAGIPATFPTSLASFENSTDGTREAALVEKLKEAGIEAKITRSRTVRAQLPDFIEKDGRKFNARGGIVEFERAVEAVNGTVFLSLDFEAQGSVVWRILGVRQVEAPVPAIEREATASAGWNGTTAANGTG